MKESRTLKVVRKLLTEKKPDTERALMLLNRAVGRGDASSAYALATWYLHGTHVRKNFGRGAALLQQAARANIPEALYDLAVSYEKGAGITRSKKTAYELYLRAALWGDKQAVRSVGRCLYYGIGVTQNRRHADIWLDRAEAADKNKP